MDRDMDAEQNDTTPAGRRSKPQVTGNPNHFSRGSIALGNRVRHNALMVADRFLAPWGAAKWLDGPRKKLLARVQGDLQRRPPGVLVDIPRRRDLDPEEFYRRYVRKGEPVLLEGAARNWTCSGKWSAQYFAEKYGDDEITLAPSGLPFSDSAQKSTITLREVLNNRSADEFRYLRFHPMLALHPELARDVPREWFEAHKGRRSLWHSNFFFIGSKGTSTGMHSAQACNLFALIRGEKAWRIYPPGYTALMDPPASLSPFRLSRHNKGLFEDPVYNRLNGYKVHMRAGDVLWNPPFYWHSVLNLTDTIGFGYRWNDHMLALKMHPVLTFVDLFVRDPSWFQLARTARKQARL